LLSLVPDVHRLPDNSDLFIEDNNNTSDKLLPVSLTPAWKHFQQKSYTSKRKLSKNHYMSGNSHTTAYQKNTKKTFYLKIFFGYVGTGE
jgi:hypothetical protein